MSIIEREAIEAANEELARRGLVPFEPDETRRNIVVEGTDVYALLGREFCKREIYKLRQHCSCVLTVRQDRCHVRIDARTAMGWQVKLLSKPADVLALPEFGLRCRGGVHLENTAVSLLPRSRQESCYLYAV